MRYFLSCLLLLGLWGRAQAQLNRAEYFLDTDPGLGRATTVSIAPAADINTTFNVPLTSASTGFHTLYLRTRDVQRRWSHTTAQPFFVTTVAASSQVLSRAEYFIDQDPGLGLGTTVSNFPSGQASVPNLSFTVPLTGAAPGFHALYLRTRDAQGAWSHTQQHPFYVLGVPPAGQALTRAEYFLDTDPGLGRATAVPNFPSSQNDASVPFNVNLGTATLGGHVLYVRVADRNGAWSEAQPYAFVAEPGGALATITAFKYQFVSPAYTSGIFTYNVPMPAASVNPTFAADMNTLPGDAEYTMHIWAVSSNGLQSLVLTKRIRNCNNPPTEAAFELAQAGRDVQFVNGTTHATTYAWDFGDGTTSALANPLHTYANLGNYTVRLIASSVCNADTAIKPVSIRGIRDITTNHGGNTGAVSVVVTGAGFVPNMQLLLRRAGQADIEGDTVIARSLSVLTTGFDLTGKALGQWDVVAVYPGGFTATLPGGFTVEAGTAPALWTKLTGPNTLRIGFNQIYTLTYGNSGNTDAVFVPIIICGLPDGTEIQGLESLVDLDLIPGLDTLRSYPANQSLTQRYTRDGTAFRILFLDKISAGSQGTLSFVFHLPQSAQLGQRAAIKIVLGKPIYSSVDGLWRNPSPTLQQCNASVRENAITSTLAVVFRNPVLNCAIALRSQYDAVLNTIQRYMLNRYNTLNTVSHVALDFSNLHYKTYDKMKNCFLAAGMTLAAAETIPVALTAAAAGLAFDAIVNYDYTVDCEKIYLTWAYDSFSALVGNAADPNAKYGPGGGSTHHYINKDAPLGYTIAFENLPAANLNAQTVRVTDTLSTQAFDLSSFAFTSVTLGETVYTLPAPAKSFIHDFDFVAQYGVKARVVGTFDSATGIVHWTFFTIDPVTNQVTTNALAGFLPPNTVSPRGQGYVSFTVNANPARQTGDVIGNRASIVFDFNPPILTNNWHNTFDLVRPISAVTSLVPTAADSVFRVNWAGTDVGSAIQSYDILYTVNGRYPRTWLAGTSLTSSLFTGQRDSTYCFYSVARDSAGNVEAAPPTPDACRTIVLSQQLARQGAAFTLYPNPTPGLFTVETRALKPESTTIEVEDVMGRVLYRTAVRLGEGVQRHVIDASHFAPGLYFVRLKLDGKTTVRKLVKT